MKNRWQLLKQFDFLQLIQFQNDLFSHLIDFNWKYAITFVTIFFIVYLNGEYLDSVRILRTRENNLNSTRWWLDENWLARRIKCWEREKKISFRRCFGCLCVLKSVCVHNVWYCYALYRVIDRIALYVFRGSLSHLRFDSQLRLQLSI